MSIASLLESYRSLPVSTPEITQEYVDAIRIQRLHDTGDVVPMSLFIQGVGARYTDERGFGIYLNKAGMRTHFVPCLHPSYFKDFEGTEAVKKYPYVLWFERKEN